MVFIGSDSIVLLVVKSDSSRVFSSSLVSNSVKQVFCLVDDDVGLDAGVFLIFDFEVVSWEGLDGEVGCADGSVSGHNVSSLGHASCGNIVDVGFICFSHRYEDICITKQ